MSISSVRRAFQEQLGDRASCLHAGMQYAGAGKGHVLTFKVQHDKTTETITGECLCGEKPEAAAQQIAAEFVKALDSKKAGK